MNSDITSRTENIRRWHHRPSHVFTPNTAYIITAATHQKQKFFHKDDHLSMLQSTILEVFDAYQWCLEAWAVFPNHYHVIATSTIEAKPLKSLIQRLHSQSSRHINKMDNTPERQIWFQYWDTCLTYEASYFARLNYVINNPVKHDIVPIADTYPFCSASWFKADAEDSFRKKVESFRYDNVNVPDDF